MPVRKPKIKDVQMVFRNAFGFTPPFQVQSPTCLPLFGNLTESSKGLAMGVALEPMLSMAGAPRTDGRIELVCHGHDEKASFWMTRLEPQANAPWADPIIRTLAQLRKREIMFSGFNAAVLPPEDTASEEMIPIATALLIRELRPFTITASGLIRPPERDKRNQLPPLKDFEAHALASLCQRARSDKPEHISSLPFLTALNAQEYHAVCLDYHHETARPIVMAGSLALIICPTATDQPFQTDWQTNFHTHAQSAAEKLRGRSLRSVDLEWLNEHKAKLTPDEFRVARYVVEEIIRTVYAEKALNQSDPAQFAAYLTQSHEAGRELLNNTSPHTDLMFQLARSHPACLGARVIGDGFDHPVIALIEHFATKDFIQSISKLYQDLTGKKVQPKALPFTKAAGSSKNRW